MPTVVLVIGSGSSFLKYTDVCVKWLLRVWTNVHQWDVTPRKGEIVDLPITHTLETARTVPKASENLGARGLSL